MVFPSELFLDGLLELLLLFIRGEWLFPLAGEHRWFTHYETTDWAGRIQSKSYKLSAFSIIYIEKPGTRLHIKVVKHLREVAVLLK